MTEKAQTDKALGALIDVCKGKYRQSLALGINNSISSCCGSQSAQALSVLGERYVCAKPGLRSARRSCTTSSHRMHTWPCRLPAKMQLRPMDTFKNGHKVTKLCTSACATRTAQRVSTPDFASSGM